MQCPICRASDPAETLRVTVGDAAEQFCPASRDPDRHARLVAAIESLWGRREASLMHCAACGFRFADPHVAGDDRFYAILHEQSGYPADRWEYGEVARDFAAHAGPTGERHVLDIGAGGGNFLVKLPQGAALHATEMSDTLREGLRRRKIDARADLAAFAGDFAGRFSLVTLFQVIEHIADPRGLLGAIRGLLGPDGFLALSTPEGDEQAQRYRVTRMPDMPPNHVSIYNGSSMARLLEECGFEVVGQRRQPPSARQALYALQLLTLRHARERPASLAGAAQRVRHQRARHLLTAAAGVTGLPKVAMHFQDAKRSCNFLTLARPRQG